MRLDIGQHLRMDQQMKMSPRIIQAMEILQMPMFALTERIDQELQANPVLEIREPDDEPSAPADEAQTVDRGEQDMVIADGGETGEDFERLAEFEREFGQEFIAEAPPPYRPPRPTGERDKKLDAMANAPANGMSLNEHLHQQWSFVETNPTICDTGKIIIDEIDDDGYLRTPLDDLIQKARENGSGDLEQVSEDDWQEALGLIQTLDPVGVGSADLRECLAMQLKSEADIGKDVSLEMEIVENFLRDIELNRLPNIAKRTGKSIEQVNLAIENISHLTPRPGSLVGQRDVPVISPDIFVEIDENGNSVITASDGSIPRLRISRPYKRLAKDTKSDSKTKHFLQDNIRSAQWLLDAIQQRKQTVLQVAKEVFIIQREFLDVGRRALKPLPMAYIAEKVGVHVATVSRAAAGKYVQTPRGIFPLRMFFSGGMKTEEGKEVAWDVVRVKLQEIINSEDKSKPLNDDELKDALAENGFKVARRTVAKYRGIMKIPPARKRRKY